MRAMDDVRLGRLVRMMRIRRGWRQEDLALHASVSRTAVSRVECGRVAAMPVATIRRICAALEISIELLPRGRGADLDRLVSARHTALHEAVAKFLAAGYADWEAAHEVSFNIWGERGVIDLLLWHAGSQALLIIEFKTELADLGELIATMDRRRRLGAEIVRARGWIPRTVSTWVIVARSRTTERRLRAHGTLLRGAFPDDDRRVRTWLADPRGAVSALSLWRAPTGMEFAPTERVRRRDQRASAEPKVVRRARSG